MGTSLSGLTPATTFDGLLKVGDNDPLTADLKAISDGSGNDSAIQLSTGELKVIGQFNLDSDTAETTINLRGDGLSINQIYQANNVTYNSIVLLNSSGIRLNNGTGTALLARGGNVGIGGITATPSARLQVKGSGTTSATTSLLVQNSAGTDALKVQDDGAIDFGLLGLEFSNDGSGGAMSVASDRYIKLASSLNTYSALNAHVFKTLGSGGYSEAMRITGNTDQFVGIGETTPTARLHVKGSGNDNTTTSLLVENSDGTELLKITDDGFVNTRQTLILNHPTNSLRSLRLGWGSMYATDNASELQIGAVYSQNTAPGIILGGKTRAGGADAVLVQALNGMYLSTTVSTEDPSAQLHIKGSGNDATTTALLVENSAGTEHLKVTDDGVTNVRGDLVVNHPSVSSRFIGLSWGAIGANSTNDELSLYGGGSTNGSVVFLNASGKTAAPAAIGMKTNGMLVASAMVQSSFAPDASAQLQVDSTTQGFLPPRMTDAERDAIATPAAGLMIYDTANNQMNYWNGSTWIAF